MIDMILKPIRALLRLNPVKPKVEIKCEDGKCVLVVDKRDEILSVEDIYTPLSVAKEEIWRRWNDEELKKKIEKFLGDIPECIKNEPKAISARQIATPNKEFFHFFDMAKMTDLKPLCWEYHCDRFITTNRDKAGLGKLGFLNGFDKKMTLL